MYEVARHSYGRPLIQRGPMAGCYDFPRHQWRRVNVRPLGLKKAVELANEQDCRAVVTPWQKAGAVYDNGKAPAVPAGWRPESFVREVA